MSTNLKSRRKHENLHPYSFLFHLNIANMLVSLSISYLACDDGLDSLGTLRGRRGI